MNSMIAGFIFGVWCGLGLNIHINDWRYWVTILLFVTYGVVMQIEGHRN
jgi:uncharacterized membrane protein YoaK (UPF0700 family)